MQIRLAAKDLGELDLHFREHDQTGSNNTPESIYKFLSVIAIQTNRDVGNRASDLFNSMVEMTIEMLYAILTHNG